MADLFRVVRTRVGGGGIERIASEPLFRSEAMVRFNVCVSLGMDRLRVVREQDYEPSELGPQNQPGVYRGEAARVPAPVHYGDQLTPTACDLTEEQLQFADNVTLTSSRVTCERCRTALAGPAGGR